MKPHEISQAVIELCDAVEDFSSRVYGPEVLFCHGRVMISVGDGVLATIAQHAKIYAAQHDWMPRTSRDHDLYLEYRPDKYTPTRRPHTKWLPFDPTQIGSEELQWIKAVTEMAKLNATKEN